MLSIAVALESGKLPEEARWLYERVAELERSVRAQQSDEPGLIERAQRLFEENAWLHELLTRVAHDLDCLGNQPARSQDAKDLLLARAELIRKQALEGPPAGWRAGAWAESEERRDEAS